MTNKYMTGLKVRYYLDKDNIREGKLIFIYSKDKLPTDYLNEVDDEYYYLVETDFEELGVETIIVPESDIMEVI